MRRIRGASVARSRNTILRMLNSFAFLQMALYFGQDMAGGDAEMFEQRVRTGRCAEASHSDEAAPLAQISSRSRR